MSGTTTFTDAVRPLLGRHGAAAQTALAALGAEASVVLDTLDSARRAALVDKLVRNLKLPVEAAPPVERELLATVRATPTGLYEWRLGSATAVVELRSGLRYLATWLGFTWQELSRLQAVVGNLVRWVQTAGGGVVAARVEPNGVRFHLSLSVPGVDSEAMRASPFVKALVDVSNGLRVDQAGDAVQLEFSLATR